MIHCVDLNEFARNSIDKFFTQPHHRLTDPQLGALRLVTAPRRPCEAACILGNHFFLLQAIVLSNCFFASKRTR